MFWVFGMGLGVPVSAALKRYSINTKDIIELKIDNTNKTVRVISGCLKDIAVNYSAAGISADTITSIRLTVKLYNHYPTGNKIRRQEKK